MYMYLYLCSTHALQKPLGKRQTRHKAHINIIAIFYPFSQFCEINTSLPSLQQQPNTAPNLFQRGVEYGNYDSLLINKTIISNK